MRNCLRLCRQQVICYILPVNHSISESINHQRSLWPRVLVFQGCCNKSPQTGQLKTTEMYSLTVLEPRSLKSRCKQGWFLLQANLYHACLPACGVCDLLMILGLGLQMHHSKLRLHFHLHSQGRLLIRTPVISHQLPPTPCSVTAF